MGEPAIKNDNNITMTKKQVQISGFTTNGRTKELERKKDKLAKKGWELEEYFEEGMAKSHAIFKRPSNIKDPIHPAIKIGGAIFIVLVVIGIFNQPSEEEKKAAKLKYEQEKQQEALKQAQVEKVKVEKEKHRVKEEKNKKELAEQKEQLHKKFIVTAHDKLYKLMTSKIHPVAKKKITPKLHHFYYGNESFFHCMFQGSSCGIFQAKQSGNDAELLWVNGNSKEWELKGVKQSEHKTDIAEIFKEASGIKEVYEDFIKNYLVQFFPSVDINLNDENFNLKWLFIAVPLNQWNRLGREQKRNVISEVIMNMKQTYPKGRLQVTIGQPNVVFGEAEWGSFSDSPDIEVKI